MKLRSETQKQAEASTLYSNNWPTVGELSCDMANLPNDELPSKFDVVVDGTGIN